MAVEECRWVCSTLVQPFPPLHPRGIKDRVEYNSRHVSQLWVRRGPLFGFPGTCPVRICSVHRQPWEYICSMPLNGATLAPFWKQDGCRTAVSQNSSVFPHCDCFFWMLQGTRVKECRESSHVGDKNCFIGREAN